MPLLVRLKAFARGRPSRATLLARSTAFGLVPLAALACRMFVTHGEAHFAEDDPRVALRLAPDDVRYLSNLSVLPNLKDTTPEPKRGHHVCQLITKTARGLRPGTTANKHKQTHHRQNQFEQTRTNTNKHITNKLISNKRDTNKHNATTSAFGLVSEQIHFKALEPQCARRVQLELAEDDAGVQHRTSHVVAWIPECGQRCRVLGEEPRRGSFVLQGHPWLHKKQEVPGLATIHDR